MKPTFTLLAFHYFLSNVDETHPDLRSLLKRLENEAIYVDQGVYILRTQQDAALIGECLDYFQERGSSFALVRFEPKDDNLQCASIANQTLHQQIELWTLNLEEEGD